MPSIEFANLIYLGLFLLVIAGSYIVTHRGALGQVAQYAAIWGLIFVGALLAVGAWDEVRGVVTPRASVAQDGSAIRVPQSADGHFYLTLQVNGAPVRFVVDTGASDIVLSREDAITAGLAVDDLIFSGRAMTANGTVQTAPVRLDRVAIGAVEDRGVRAVVNTGEMPESLLGMGYLGRFESLQIADGELVLTR